MNACVEALFRNTKDFVNVSCEKPVELQTSRRIKKRFPKLIQVWKPMGRRTAQWIFTHCLQDISVSTTGVFKRKCEWKCCFAQSCLALCDCRPPGSSVHGILWVRILVWVAIPFSRGSFRPGNRTWRSCIAGRLFTIWSPYKISGWCLATGKGMWGCREEGATSKPWREASWETSWHLYLGLPASSTWEENLVVSATQSGVFFHGSPSAPKQSSRPAPQHPSDHFPLITNLQPANFLLWMWVLWYKYD